MRYRIHISKVQNYKLEQPIRNHMSLKHELFKWCDNSVGDFGIYWRYTCNGNFVFRYKRHYTLFILTWL